MGLKARPAPTSLVEMGVVDDILHVIIGEENIPSWNNEIKAVVEREKITLGLTSRMMVRAWR